MARDIESGELHFGVECVSTRIYLSRYAFDRCIQSPAARSDVYLEAEGGVVLYFHCISAKVYSRRNALNTKVELTTLDIPGHLSCFAVRTI